MDYYELLGVRRSASAAEIRRAYQKLARQLHPDLNPGDPVAADRFRTVSVAFEVLTDPQRRGQYDRGEQPPAVAPSPEVGFEGFDFSAEVRTGAAELPRDLRRRPASARPPPPRRPRGEDLEQVAEVTFEEAFHGATPARPPRAPRSAAPGCGGAGEIAFNPRPCPHCGGSGQVRARRGRMIFTAPLRRSAAPPAPWGAAPARAATARAASCRASGSTVHDPARRRGRQPPARRGRRQRRPRAAAPRATSCWWSRSRPHPFYRRDGEDLHCQVPITMTEAALGAHVEVPTPDGAGADRGAGGHADRPALPPAQARPAAAGREGARRPVRGGAGLGAAGAPTTTAARLLREFARRNPHDPRAERGLLRYAGAKE